MLETLLAAAMRAEPAKRISLASLSSITRSSAVAHPRRAILGCAALTQPAR